MAKFPADRRYSDQHFWAKREGDLVLVGLSSYGVEQLGGDITGLSISARAGGTLRQGASFGSIESVASSGDLTAPISGKVERVNNDLTRSPDGLTAASWLIAIRPSEASELDDLQDAAAYERSVG